MYWTGFAAGLAVGVVMTISIGGITAYLLLKVAEHIFSGVAKNPEPFYRGMIYAINRKKN